MTFPPSKNFEPYLHAFLSQRTVITEGHVDVLTKYCLKRLAAIAKKGARGKPPSLAEIETVSVCFRPHTYTRTSESEMSTGCGIPPINVRRATRCRISPTRVQHPKQKVPIVLPFLADGVLVLGGTKAEGIFRVPGDSDAVAALKMWLDRSSYTLEGVDGSPRTRIAVQTLAA